jgi:hypothetical protein
MPWIEGPTWMEIMFTEQALTPQQSLDMARALAALLADMEQEDMAHCDLSGPNVLLPGILPATSQAASGESLVALVDVEQMYGPGLKQPDALPAGSSGYAHRVAPDGLWGPEADRFAGAMILAEMLGWCDDRVRNAAWGESYFSPGELQQDTERYKVMHTVLRERWGEGVAWLFSRAWESEKLDECPTFGSWVLQMPNDVPEPTATISEHVQAMPATSNIILGYEDQVEDPEAV